MPGLYAAYSFKQNGLDARVFYNGREDKTLRGFYDYPWKIGSVGYTPLIDNNNISTMSINVRKGSLNFYYPTDIVRMSVK